MIFFQYIQKENFHRKYLTNQYLIFFLVFSKYCSSNIFQFQQEKQKYILLQLYFPTKTQIQSFCLQYRELQLYYKFEASIIEMSKQLSNQAKQYESSEFKMLYNYIKTLNLINQLYLSQAMDRKQFQEEEKDILSRYQKIKQQIKNNNQYVDFQRFAELYGVQNEYKRIQSDPKTDEDKKIIQVAILLTSKMTECFDIIHQSKLVKDLINIITEIDMLLKKLKINAKKISAQFSECMNRVTEIKQSYKKKSIHQELSAMEMLQLQDSITKIKFHFQEFSAL